MPCKGKKQGNPVPKKKKTPDWVKRAGRRTLTEPEAAKVEARRVDTVMATRRAEMQKARVEALRKKPKPKPKPKPWYKRYNPFAILAEGPLAPKKEKE